jgi:catechol 2,3-dioxygenase-like lactoylglutathione lyase family enzyme
MPSDTAPAVQHLSAIAGFRLVTADLCGLSMFYRDVLGFAAEAAEQAISGEEISLLGLHGTGRRNILRLGRQTVSIEQFDPPGRPYPPGAGAACLSFQHLALVVADMAEAYQRVRGETAISEAGPQHLPASSGGVHAYKFRDPDGHPLELLQFPQSARPKRWQGKRATGRQIGLGIDHSAISVADADASAAFYAALGLTQGARSFNCGPQQNSLDKLRDAEVTVTPMQPVMATPHLELLGYRMSRGAETPVLQADDVAATRIVWLGSQIAVLRDPDSHLHQIVASRQELPP